MLKLEQNGFCEFNTFLYYLEDIIGCQFIDGQSKRSPDIWSQLNQSQLENVLKNIYNEQKNVDWRSFVFRVSGLRSPTIAEILEMQKQFKFCGIVPKIEIISKRKFNRCILWFEKDFETSVDTDDEKYWLTFKWKTLIFKMYCTCISALDYTKFLFDLCKSHDIFISLVKVMSLVSGKEYCMNIELSQQYQRELKNQRKNAQIVAKEIFEILFETIDFDGLEENIAEAQWEIESFENEEYIEQSLSETIDGESNYDEDFTEECDESFFNSKNKLQSYLKYEFFVPEKVFLQAIFLSYERSRLNKIVEECHLVSHIIKLYQTVFKNQINDDLILPFGKEDTIQIHKFSQSKEVLEELQTNHKGLKITEVIKQVHEACEISSNNMNVCIKYHPLLFVGSNVCQKN